MAQLGRVAGVGHEKCAVFGVVVDSALGDAAAESCVATELELVPETVVVE